MGVMDGQRNEGHVICLKLFKLVYFAVPFSLNIDFMYFS